MPRFGRHGHEAVQRRTVMSSGAYEYGEYAGEERGRYYDEDDERL